jgi:hypothetical protein
VLSSGFSRPAIPIGLAITLSVPTGRVGCRAPSSVTATATTPASQRAGRQRGESGRPVGNSKGVNTSARATTRYHTHPPYQAATTSPATRLTV